MPKIIEITVTGEVLPPKWQKTLTALLVIIVVLVVFFLATSNQKPNDQGATENITKSPAFIGNNSSWLCFKVPVKIYGWYVFVSNEPVDHLGNREGSHGWIYIDGKKLELQPLSGGWSSASIDWIAKDVQRIELDRPNVVLNCSPN